MAARWITCCLQIAAKFFGNCCNFRLIEYAYHPHDAVLKLLTLECGQALVLLEVHPIKSNCEV